MVHRTGDTVEDITLCPKCKHLIVFQHSQTTREELYTLSRHNTVLPYSAPVYLTDEYTKNLDDEIVNLEESLDRLRVIREEYRLEKRIRLSLSTPIRTLPEELLCEIFEYCCAPTGDIRPNEFGPGGFLQTLALSHVSHHWRSVVMSNSCLWTDITLYLPVDDFNPTRELLEIYFSRSGNALLDICLNIFLVDMAFNSEDEENASRQLRLLASHQSRWRSLTIDYALLDWLEQQYDVPSLVELTITNKSGQTVISRPIKSFKNLRSIRRVNVAINLENLMIPWSQINEVEVHGGRYGDLEMVAASCQSIASLTYTRLSPLSSGYSGYRDLNLSSLESLNLLDIFMDPRDRRPTELNGILSHAACPRLSHLSMHSSTMYNQKWPLEAFKIFLSSAPLLSVLKLEGLLLDPHFLVECFPYLQNVTRLIIFNCLEIYEDEYKVLLSKAALDESLFRSLIFGTTDRKDPNGPALQELLPSLQALHLRAAHMDLDSSFVNFVSSRRVASTSVAQLIEVKLDFEDMLFTLSDEDRLRLKDLCREGLKIFDCGYMLDGQDKRPFSLPRTWLA